MTTAISKLSLKPGIHTFPKGIFGSTSRLIQETNDRKNGTLIIACSELGAAPDHLSFTQPGQCVVLQHLAASIQSKSESEMHPELSFSDVERLIKKCDFSHVVVCGHLRCNVIRNWLNPNSSICEDSGKFRMRFERGTRRFVDRHYSSVSASERCTLMICEHVLLQIENFMTHPFVEDRVVNDQTSLHGWVIDDDSARVLGYRPEESAFVSL